VQFDQVCIGLQVMHPKNPFAPTVHFNYRYFETDAPRGIRLIMAWTLKAGVEIGVQRKLNAVLGPW
jgi:coproporphyrinogen III oxidase